MNKITLKEIVDLKKGKKVTQNLFPNNNSFRYIQIEDLRNDNNLKYTSDTKAVWASEDDILIAWDGANAGTVGYYLSGAIGSTITRIRLKEEQKDKIFSQYLGLFLQSKSSYLRDNANGATIPHLDRTSLLSLELPIPDFSAQKKIISMINRINQIINIRKQQLQEMDNLIESVFINKFGNPLDPENKTQRKKISEMFEVKSGSTPSRKNSKYWKNGKIEWVKTNEVLNNYIDRTAEKITIEALEETSVKLFPKNTVLIAMYGQGRTRGRTALLNIEATTNQACAGLIPNDVVNMKFIFHQIRFSYENLRKLARGGNQPNLNLGLIKNYELIFPPLTIQNEFVSFVNEVESQKQVMQESLELMEENLNALIQKAFSGELVSEEQVAMK